MSGYAIRHCNVPLSDATHIDGLPEQAGYAYWLDVLDREDDRTAVLMFFSEGQENRNTLAATIGKGFDYVPFA